MKKNRLSAMFNIQPGEGRIVSLLLLQYFLLGGAFNFVQTAAFSLFLVQFSAQTLAYVYIANALVGTLITTAYLRLGQRISFPKLLTANLGFLLALVIGFWLSLGFSGANWVVFALPVLFQILINLGNLSFWPLAGRLFNVRQGKRLFGLVGSGQWIAIVLTGFLIPSLVRWIGPTNLLILGAASLMGALAVNRMITRIYAPALKAQIEVPAATRARQSKSGRPASLFRNRYTFLIFTLVFLWWLAFFFLDNLFYAVAAVQFPDAEALASFLGYFLAGLGILTLFSNFFITGPVISRFGLQTSLLVLPVLLVLGTGSMTILAALGVTAGLLFWLVTIDKLLDMALGLSIDRSAQMILYQPLPPGQRLQVQTMADGVIQLLANGAAGLALLALGALFASYINPLIVSVLLVVIAWALVAFWLGREYPRMLVQALAKRRLEGIQMPACDASSLAALMEGLRNPKPAAAIYAANTLESIDSNLLTKALPEMLKHPAAEVRRDALQRIVRLEMADAFSAVLEICRQDSSPTVLAAAVQTLAVLGNNETLHEVFRYLDHPDQQVRLSAITGLARSGVANGNLIAEQKMLAMVASSQDGERLLAAQALGEIGGQSYYKFMATLLDDEVLIVRQAALKSAARFNEPLFWVQIIKGLDAQQTRSAAEAALVSGGNQAMPAMAEAFADPQTSQQALVSLARACGRIQGEDTIALLKNKTGVPDQEVRMQVLRSLSRCGYQASATDRSQLKEQIISELSQATWVMGLLRVLRANQEITLLRTALDSELERSLERAFHLLSFIAGGKSILQARENLRLASPEKHAYALEVIDVSIPNDLKGALFPFVEDLTPDQRLEHLGVIFPQPECSLEQGLRDLLAVPPGRLMAWTQATALFAIREASLTELGDPVKIHLTALDPLLRETAIGTLAGLHTDRQKFNRALLNDPDPGVRRIARYWTDSQNGEEIMLSTVEKVIILKGASIFSETPDEILAEVAQALEEVEVVSGETIFEKGDAGDSMYILASGKVRVHDGAHTLSTLAEGDVFGEMALLDPEARVASVTADEDSVLLRLDQEAFSDLMTDRIEVARGIIKVLTHRLRERLRDLNELHTRYEAVQAESQTIS